jgi:hypothetical protein
MKITNKHGLPETFINVIKRPQYTRGDSQISATEIMKSPRIVRLEAKHWSDLETDASEMVWSIFGTAVHGVLEHGKGSNHVVEERLHTTFHDWKLSGSIDLQEIEEDGIVISDYKVTSAWSVMNAKQDWHNQLNIYAWLVQRVKNAPVKKAQIVAIIRDWSSREAKTREAYPQSPVMIIDIPVWTEMEQSSYIADRLGLHTASLTGELEECTAEEMWEKPAMYAIRKPANKRATSVHSSLDEATEALKAVKGEAIIETRPGERTRCANWCSVSAHCSQYQNYLEAQGETNGMP